MTFRLTFENQGFHTCRCSMNSPELCLSTIRFDGPTGFTDWDMKRPYVSRRLDDIFLQYTIFGMFMPFSVRGSALFVVHDPAMEPKFPRISGSAAC